MVGVVVLELQWLFIVNGFIVLDIVVYCVDIVVVVCVVQICFGLVVDGIVGFKIMVVLQFGVCNICYLMVVDLQVVVEMFDVFLVVVCVVNEVESFGNGFLFDGCLVILFEWYIMYCQFICVGKDVDVLVCQFFNLVNFKCGGYVGNVGEYMCLVCVIQIDEDCVFVLVSWGVFQIMGFYWNLFDYFSVQYFVVFMCISEVVQFDVFVCFVKVDFILFKVLCGCKWFIFVRLYNGFVYEVNFYDVKFVCVFDCYQVEEEVVV